eukprot:15021372-Alexandrium_andersonii.AAC.1
MISALWFSVAWRFACWEFRTDWNSSEQDANKASIAARVSLTEPPWDWKSRGACETRLLTAEFASSAR